MLILVINSGSSSVKFQIFEKNSKQLKPIVKGIADALKQKHSEIRIADKSWKMPLLNHTDALKKIFKQLLSEKWLGNLSEIEVIGHRVVHGGEKYFHSTKITANVIKDIKKLSSLAPLHNPPNLEGIVACQKIFKKTPQFAIFDTAFHLTVPQKAYLYGIDTDYYRKFKVRRYGFHGINHEYISQTAKQILKKHGYKAQKILSIHLGNGCSISGIKDGKSLENTMGFSPLEGLIMGTRSGDIDPALIPYLEKNLHLNTAQVLEILNKKSGLLGISHLGSDMRVIWAACQKNDQKAKLALEMYCYSIAKHLNGIIGAINGLDAIIFTGGIGENAWYVRQEVINYLGYLNIKLDNSKNHLNKEFIQSKNSSKPVLIIPANEELMIAEKTLKHLLKS
ncbi:acetate kinase [Candidatus Peregrinibacteria bacterium]|nr:acetate kinase [Candidatus Peregrinibacteria bacterium]